MKCSVKKKKRGGEREKWLLIKKGSKRNKNYNLPWSVAAVEEKKSRTRKNRDRTGGGVKAPRSTHVVGEGSRKEGEECFQRNRISKTARKSYHFLGGKSKHERGSKNKRANGEDILMATLEFH